jgi:hypothetical protein
MTVWAIKEYPPVPLPPPRVTIGTVQLEMYINQKKSGSHMEPPPPPPFPRMANVSVPVSHRSTLCSHLEDGQLFDAWGIIVSYTDPFAWICALQTNTLIRRRVTWVLNRRSVSIERIMQRVMGYDACRVALVHYMDCSGAADMCDFLIRVMKCPVPRRPLPFFP